MGWQGIALGIAAMLVLAGGVWLLFRGSLRYRADAASAETQNEAYEESHEARKRFDRAAGRSLSADVDALLARYRARKRRRGLPDDTPSGK